MAKTPDIQFGYFDRFVPTYDEERVVFIADDLAARGGPSLKVADLGCGDGAMLAYLREKAGVQDTLGVDPSPAYIDSARERSGGEFQVGSVLDEQTLRSWRDSYDAVILVAVLHHLVGRTRRTSFAHVRTALENALGMLAPGGRLYVFEPTHEPQVAMFGAYWAKNVLMPLVGNRRVEVGKGWINFGAPLVSYLTRSQLRSAVADAGGAIVEEVLVSSVGMGPITRYSLGLVVERTERR